jgi:hypothetical protein
MCCQLMQTCWKAEALTVLQRVAPLQQQAECTTTCRSKRLLDVSDIAQHEDTIAKTPHNAPNMCHHWTLTVCCDCLYTLYSSTRLAEFDDHLLWELACGRIEGAVSAIQYHIRWMPSVERGRHYHCSALCSARKLHQGRAAWISSGSKIESTGVNCVA